MSPGTAIVLIVLIIAIAGVLKSGHRARQGSEPGHDAGREAELQREIEELRERVQVLERIATDGGEAKRLSAEIERLRDES